MTAGSKQHKATAGVPDGRLFLIEKKGIVENEEDMETSVYGILALTTILTAVPITSVQAAETQY